MFRTPHLASMKTEEKFMFLIYGIFLGLSRGEETFVFGKCYEAGAFNLLTRRRGCHMAGNRSIGPLQPR